LVVIAVVAVTLAAPLPAGCVAVNVRVTAELLNEEACSVNWSPAAPGPLTVTTLGVLLLALIAGAALPLRTLPFASSGSATIVSGAVPAR
jgi:hypothetical protein